MIKKLSNQKTYKHLSLDERETIALDLAAKKPMETIAKNLLRHPSTIYREIKRNSADKYDCQYRANRVQLKNNIRKKNAHKRVRLKNDFIITYVETQLKNDLSPEQIAGRLSIDFPGYKTNHESIYLYIYNEAPKFKEFLRKKHKKRQKRGSILKRRGIIIKNKVMISERPLEINDRTEIGHWEADAIVSRKSKAALSVICERKTRLVKINKLDSKTARNMSKNINYRLSRLPVKFRKSITYDNGTENAEHEKINRVLNIKSFFCNPYHSWEKGTVENTNGLIRYYLPKKTDFSIISEAVIKEIENRLNNRPRKCLNFKTPSEVFTKFALNH